LGEFHGLALHDLLAFFDVVLFALFHNLPQLVGDDVSALVEFVLGLVVFTEVGVFVRELVEVLNKLLKDFLFIVETV